MADTEHHIVIARAGYLALSDPSTGFEVGVMGATEAEASQRLEQALSAWRELRARRTS